MGEVKIERMTDQDRIQRRIYKKPNGCHGWYGCTDSSGFPTAMAGGKNVKVHRWLFARKNPRVNIKGWCVIQKCLDKRCLNVSHMRRMTKVEADLLRDPLARRTKLLSWDIVRSIRQVPKGTGTKELRERTGLAKSTIRRIRNNETWRE